MTLEFEQTVSKLASILKIGSLTEAQLKEAVKIAAGDAIAEGAIQKLVANVADGTTYSPWVHNKTGNVYFRITPCSGAYDTALNCTNAVDPQEVVLYTDSLKTRLFVREKQEFLDRFTYAPWWG